ncbi:MAG: hypothetical protein PHX92_02760 [Candidatus Pacebacteria bacterium]|nr:hypothetical protein [Candidatus Paceibacterota bacterium]
MNEKKFMIATIVAIFVALAFVIAMQGPVIVPVAEKTSIIIDGPDSFEVGEKIKYTATLTGVICIGDIAQALEWEVSRGGQIMSSDGDSVVVSACSPTEFTVYATFGGITTSKVVKVYPRASIGIEMDPWIHPNNWYFTGIDTVGVGNVNLRLYKVLETGRKVEVDSSRIWESYSHEEIIFYECGNYLLVAEARALSGDNRLIQEEQLVTVTPYVQRGFHKFSWDNEDIVQLTPADKVAIKTFIEEEIGIEFTFESEKVKKVNSFSEGLIFYKDNSRDDTILYQKDVKIISGDIQEMSFIQIKDKTQRYWYIYWNDCVVSVSRNSAISGFSYSGGGSSSSSSSGSSSGGNSPSPGIGGGSPSPSI